MEAYKIHHLFLWFCYFCLVLLCVPVLADARGNGIAPVDFTLFRPALGYSSLTTLDLPRVGDGLWQGNTWGLFHYAYRPLVYTEGGEPKLDLIRHRLGYDTGFSLVVWKKRIEIGLGLPLIVHQSGQIPEPGVVSSAIQASYPIPSVDVQDLHVMAKGVLYHSPGDPEQGVQGGIGLLGDLTLPTGNADAFSGLKYPGLTLSLLGSMQYKRVTVGLQFGGVFASQEGLSVQNLQSMTLGSSNLQTGLGMLYRLGIQVRILQRPTVTLLARAEAMGRVIVPFDDQRQHPAELDFGLVASTRYIEGVVGIGPGLTSGAETPNVRVHFGLRASWPGKQAKQKQPESPRPAPTLSLVPSPSTPPPLNAPIPPPTPHPSPALPKPVVFPEGLQCSDDLLQVGPDNVLDELVELLRSHPELTRVEVIAHTSNDRPELQAHLETQQCAQIVIRVLQGRGLAKERFVPRAASLLCPVAGIPSATEPDRLKHQRISFRHAGNALTLSSEETLCAP